MRAAHIDNPKIALVGLGAIGTIIAADLAKQGVKLHVVCKHEATLEQVQTEGLQVKGVSGNYSISENLHPVLQVEDLPEQLDMVLLVTKTVDNSTVLDALMPKLQPSTRIVVMQNGVPEEEIVKKLSPSQIVGCVISFGATLIAPGISEKTSHGEIILGSMDNSQNELTKQLVEWLNRVEPTVWSDNILGYKYSKLLINCAISALGAVSGMTLGQMLKRKKTRLLFLLVITEGVRVAQALDIKLETLNRLNFYSIALSRSELEKKFSWSYFTKDFLIRIVGLKYTNLRSSTLQSLERGRKTEIDSLTGHLVKKASELGMSVPLSAEITTLVHKIESEERTASLQTLIELENKLATFVPK